MQYIQKLTGSSKRVLAAVGVLLILVFSFGYLALGVSEPSADYTGIWESRDDQYVYYEKGEVDTEYTGAAKGIVNKTEGIYYVSNGEVDLTYTGLGASDSGWIYFKKGVYDRTFTGFARTGDDWYWVKRGNADMTFTGTKSGTIEGNTTWWYVEEGKADFTFDGIATIKSDLGYFKNGALDKTYTGLKTLEGTRLYFSEGRQDKKYEGLAVDEDGVWYVEHGKVNLNYNGKVKHLGRNYTVTNGVVGNGKAVYLTFDDGPGQYTDRLLDILADHNVKATFFVTASFPKYLDCLEREAAEGHTIAVHTYSHDYKKIYKSTKAYWKDFEQMEAVIEEYTGERTNVFRFPGGSSNMISKKFDEGIMTKLVKQANQKDLVYYDWNVLSGDAGNTRDPDQIYKNIVKGCANNTHSVVLCHDIHEFTVDAMDKTIHKLLVQGYVLLPLDENTPTVHQQVNN